MAGAKGNGDWDEPSFATLRGVVVSRAKINNAMYAVWGARARISAGSPESGCDWSAAPRSLWNDASSQNTVDWGGDLYAAFAAGTSLSVVITRGRGRGATFFQKPEQHTVRNWSGRRDLNPRHPAPKAGALPGCATPRTSKMGASVNQNRFRRNSESFRSFKSQMDGGPVKLMLNKIQCA